MCVSHDQWLRTRVGHLYCNLNEGIQPLRSGQLAVLMGRLQMLQQHVRWRGWRLHFLVAHCLPALTYWIALAPDGWLQVGIVDLHEQALQLGPRQTARQGCHKRHVLLWVGLDGGVARLGCGNGIGREDAAVFGPLYKGAQGHSKGPAIGSVHGLEHYIGLA